MKKLILTFLFAVWASATLLNAEELPGPLGQAHAHNDYYHKRPLLDALSHGFCSVEADVFLKNGRLLVGPAGCGRHGFEQGCSLSVNQCLMKNNG